MTNTLEELVFRFRWQIAFLLVGLALSSGGVFLVLQNKTPQFEIISQEPTSSVKLLVEISGAVKSPGVYEISSDDRVNNVIVLAGGFAEDANMDWIDKHLNKAAYLVDGQKIYIPSQGEVLSANNIDQDNTVSNVLNAEAEGSININTASSAELEELQGIGPVYAQKIIDNRPYSSVEELLMKKAVTQKIYDANRELLTVY